MRHYTQLQAEEAHGAGAPDAEVVQRLADICEPPTKGKPAPWDWLTTPGRTCAYFDGEGSFCANPIHEGRGWWVPFCEHHYARLSAGARMKLFDTYTHPLPPGPRPWGDAWISGVEELQTKEEADGRAIRVAVPQEEADG